MSREIKFRLRIQDKVVGYEKWYSGTWSQEGGYWLARPCWLYSIDGEYWNPEPIYNELKDSFTGLLDKNGKEIYEGDVVHFRDWDNGYGKEDDPIDEGVGEVKFGHNANSDVGYTHGWFIEIIVDKKYKPFGYFRGIELEEMEIIGNIYENEDLLK